MPCHAVSCRVMSCVHGAGGIVLHFFFAAQFEDCRRRMPRADIAPRAICCHFYLLIKTPETEPTHSPHAHNTYLFRRVMQQRTLSSCHPPRI